MSGVTSLTIAVSNCDSGATYSYTTTDGLEHTFTCTTPLTLSVADNTPGLVIPVTVRKGGCAAGNSAAIDIPKRTSIAVTTSADCPDTTSGLTSARFDVTSCDSTANYSYVDLNGVTQKFTCAQLPMALSLAEGSNYSLAVTASRGLCSNSAFANFAIPARLSVDVVRTIGCPDPVTGNIYSHLDRIIRGERFAAKILTGST